MGGFVSQDDMINRMTVEGKQFRADWNKQTATAGAVIVNSWTNLLGGAGSPPRETVFGTGVTSVWKPLYGPEVAATHGGIPHGGNVNAAFTDFKVLTFANAYSAAGTSMPSTFLLVDFLAYATLTNATLATTGTKTLAQFENVTFSSSSGLLMTTTNDWDNLTPCRFTNSGGALPTGLAAGTTYWTIRVSATTSRLATSLQSAIAASAIPFVDAGTGTNTFNVRLPRYTDGAGVQSLLSVSTAGTAGTTTFQWTYTNSGGTGGRLTPSSPALPLNNATAPLLQIPYSGTGAGKFGPFMPLQGGDAGIQSVQNIILASSGVTTGVYNLVLCRVLTDLPMTTIGVPGERDLTSQIPSFPRVFDGACLGFLQYNGVATIPNNTNYNGVLQFGWS